MGVPDHETKKIRFTIRFTLLPIRLGPAGPKALRMVRTAITSPGALLRSGALGGPIAARA